MVLMDMVNASRTHVSLVAWMAKNISGISGKHGFQTHNYITVLMNSCVRRSQKQNKHSCGLDFLFSSCQI